ncbi:Uncharacterized protein FKW44_021777, partial [Caligus rogercresseyi]
MVISRFHPLPFNPWSERNSFYEFARKRPKRTGDVRRTSSLGEQHSVYYYHYCYYYFIQSSALSTLSGGCSRLRFSWDDRKTNSANAFHLLT